MTRKEQIKDFAIKRFGNEGNESQFMLSKVQACIVGAGWADKTMIDKACEWLCMNMTSIEYFGINGNIIKPDFIQRFKKAMEGE